MQQKREITWRGKISLKGVKSLICIDSSVLIDIALYEDSLNYFKKYGFQFPRDLFCVVTNSIGETKGVLINKYNKEPSWVNSRINFLLDEFYIQKLLYDESFHEEYDIIKKIGDKHGLNEEDIPIILTLWKHEISIVIARDKAFENTCKELGIDVISFPTVETFK